MRQATRNGRLFDRPQHTRYLARAPGAAPGKLASCVQRNLQAGLRYLCFWRLESLSDRSGNSSSLRWAEGDRCRGCVAGAVLPGLCCRGCVAGAVLLGLRVGTAHVSEAGAVQSGCVPQRHNQREAIAVLVSERPQRVREGQSALRLRHSSSSGLFSGILHGLFCGQRMEAPSPRTALVFSTQSRTFRSLGPVLSFFERSHCVAEASWCKRPLCLTSAAVILALSSISHSLFSAGWLTSQSSDAIHRSRSSFTPPAPSPLQRCVQIELALDRRDYAACRHRCSICSYL